MTHPAVARQRFLEIAQRSEEQIDLTEGSLVIALEEYPGLEVERYLAQLDSWGAAILERTDGARDPARLIQEVNRFLFEQEGFHGEAADYYDPRTAFLNEVLDRHAGLPITLSIVYIELSRRVGIPSSGVALPGRFLVRVASGGEQILVDPFDEGRVLTTAECQKLLDEVYGGGVQLREHHLRTCSRHEVLARLLSHLKSVYLTQNNLEGAFASVERLLVLDQGDAYEVRDRALLAMQTHRYSEALESLERYLILMPYAEDRGAVLEHVNFLKSWLVGN